WEFSGGHRPGRNWERSLLADRRLRRSWLRVRPLDSEFARSSTIANFACTKRRRIVRGAPVNKWRSGKRSFRIQLEAIRCALPSQQREFRNRRAPKRCVDQAKSTRDRKSQLRSVA